MTIGVLFVCTGNICRSPTAAGVFRTMARRAGLAHAFTIDSAGTYEGHVGQPASAFALEVAKRHGYDISDHRARLLTNADIEKFDYPLAMDRSHLVTMRWMAPRALSDRPQMFMKFAPQSRVIEVPDPYGGPIRGYEQTIALIEAGCAGLLAHLKPLVQIGTENPERKQQ